jgi:tetratricopeptide (TPR) repeat protein
LLACGEACLQEDDLDLAERCLNYARLINDTPEVSAALSRLDAKHTSQRIDDQKKIRIVRQRRERKLERIHRNKTQEVLEQTQRALDDNDLPAAHRIFLELPKSATASHEVEATRERLNKVIQARVRELTVEGDRQYRADRVSRAIRIWERAYELDPDNPKLGERLERARKVLARLEELRNKKRAPAGQPRSGT